MRYTPFVVAVAAASFSIATSSSLNAQPVNATGISASWRDAQPAGAATINNGGATKTARWGNPVTANGQSGYNFTPNALASINPIIPGDLFTLGTFVHLNNPVTAPSITSIILDFSLTIAGALPDEDFTESFTFNHFETPNNDAICANGAPNGVGVNVNGCADRVTFNFTGSATAFNLGGQDYFLDIVGFSVGGGVAVDQFWTIEEQDNEAQLIGRLVTVDPSNPVPEPAAAALLLAGLAGMATFARRRGVA